MNATEMWVCNILNSLLDDVNRNTKLKINLETPLTGQGGILDSLLLINFITELESCIKAYINDNSFQLVTPNLIDQNENIFKNLQSCSAYIKQLFDSKGVSI